MSRPEIDAIHRYVAYVSVGPSTVRGLKTRGVVSAARAALRYVDLAPYGCATPRPFHLQLDADTERVRESLPDGSQHWGVARKILNIFLRGALYNTYLNERFGLSSAEMFYEIPLDSLSATEIALRAPGQKPPRWRGVKYVTPECNVEYQRLATGIAADAGTARVHLDATFWGGR